MNFQENKCQRIAYGISLSSSLCLRLSFILIYAHAYVMAEGVNGWCVRSLFSAARRRGFSWRRGDRKWGHDLRMFYDPVDWITSAFSVGNWNTINRPCSSLYYNPRVRHFVSASESITTWERLLWQARVSIDIVLRVKFQYSVGTGRSALRVKYSQST